MLFFKRKQRYKCNLKQNSKNDILRHMRFFMIRTNYLYVRNYVVKVNWLTMPLSPLLSSVSKKVPRTDTQTYFSGFSYIRNYNIQFHDKLLLLIWKRIKLFYYRVIQFLNKKYVIYVSKQLPALLCLNIHSKISILLLEYLNESNLNVFKVELLSWNTL